MSLYVCTNDRHPAAVFSFADDARHYCPVCELLVEQTAQSMAINELKDEFRDAIAAVSDALSTVQSKFSDVEDEISNISSACDDASSAISSLEDSLGDIESALTGIGSALLKG